MSKTLPQIDDTGSPKELGKPRRRRVKRQRKFGFRLSLLLHSIVVSVAFYYFLPEWWPNIQATAPKRQIHVAFSPETASDPFADPPTPEVRMISDPADLTAKMIEQRIEERRQETEGLDEEDQLKKLDRLSNRLTRTSTDESIGEVAGKLQDLLGTKERADQPAKEPVEGDFDFDSAQIHDVKRSRNENGRWSYVTVLVDSEGRTQDVPISAAEGEPLYRTMQRIKSNPLLEKVYRKIAMPLFDKMLATARKIDAAKSK